MERQWKVKERQWKAKERQCRTFRVAAPAPESSVMFSLQHHKQKHQSLAEWQRKRKERQCLSLPHLCRSSARAGSEQPPPPRTVGSQLISAPQNCSRG